MVDLGKERKNDKYPKVKVLIILFLNDCCGYRVVNHFICFANGWSFKFVKLVYIDKHRNYVVKYENIGVRSVCLQAMRFKFMETEL